MDTITLVDDQVEDGEKLIDGLVRENVPVLAACWVKPADEDRWSLYIATPLVDEKGLLEAYREVHRIFRSLGDLWIDTSDVTLIGHEHPITREVLDLQRRHPSRTSTRIRRSGLGDLSIDEVIIYPPVKPKRPEGGVFGEKKVRLKTDVARVPSLEELVAKLTPEEEETVERLVAGGYDRERAKFWVRQQRDQAIRSQPRIPAGTVVKASIVGWWGDDPAADPNPLLEVEAEDGAQGLTHLENTEPVP